MLLLLPATIPTALSTLKVRCDTQKGDKALRSEITTFDSSPIHENFRPASFCFIVAESQASRGAMSGLLGVWMRTSGILFISGEHSVLGFVWTGAVKKK